MAECALIGADIHDGAALHQDRVLLLDGRDVVGVVDPAGVPPGCRRIALDGGTVLPGFVDLQVNGGGGAMFNDAPSVEVLDRIAKAHARAGTLGLLPTLITDTPGHSRAAVDAVERAIGEGVPGILGLHLEGPHLSPARKGAHDPALIRPMRPDDLEFLLSAARRLPNLLVTVAPESVTPDQIAALSDGGALVSLGHSDADYDTCMAAFKAGARCATHLFNAMSQLGSRSPGLVGAALNAGRVSAGLIADAIHVHPASIRAALAAKRGPGELFLVTDAMAPAGTDLDTFTLNGRRILRDRGRLTLQDGTLAGADLDMPGALRVMTGPVGIGLEQAIRMATRIPAGLLRDPMGRGALRPGAPAHLIHLDKACRATRSLDNLLSDAQASPA